MWYVIQTMTGKEEELLLFTGTILSEELRESCFVIKAEWMKRIGGAWKLQVRPLFPGYIFIETEQPDRLFLEIRKVPKYTRLLGTGRFDFVAVKEEEESFLRKVSGMGAGSWMRTVESGSPRPAEISGLRPAENVGPRPAESVSPAEQAAAGRGTGNSISDPIVKLTTLELSDEGTVLSMDGTLQYFEKEILRVNLHKRYAVVKTRMLGQERTLLFGLRLQDDRV